MNSSMNVLTGMFQNNEFHIFINFLFKNGVFLNKKTSKYSVGIHTIITIEIRNAYLPYKSVR